MATVDLAASSLAMFKEHHWLSDARNVQQLWLTGPAWQGEPTLSSAPPKLEDKRATVSAWSASRLAQFLDEHDLHGPAKHFRICGVRGVDFRSMSVSLLVAEVGLTRFAASRTIARGIFAVAR